MDFPLRRARHGVTRHELVDELHDKRKDSAARDVRPFIVGLLRNHVRKAIASGLMVLRENGISGAVPTLE